MSAIENQILITSLNETKMKGLVVSTKIKILFLSVSAILLVYSILGFLVIPAVLSDQIPKIVDEKFDRNVQIEKISFNPFSMELNLHGFDIKKTDTETFFNFENLYVNIGVVSTITDLSLHIDQVILIQPYALVKRDKQGTFNFSDLLSNKEAEPKTESADKEIFPVTISQIAISEGKLSWQDNFYSQSHQEDIFPLNLNIKDFTTLPNKQSQLAFSLKFASGGQLNWQGKLKLNPLQSNGHIELKKVNFHRVWELFLQHAVKFEVLKGSELIKADYRLTDTAEGMQIIVNNANIELYEFQLVEKETKDTLFSIPDFKLSGITVNLLNKQIEISTVSAKDAHFKAWLNTDGRLNYQTLFVTANTNTTIENEQPQPNPTTTKKTDESWNITINQLALNNFSFNFVDKSLPKPAYLDLTALNVNTTKLSNKQGTIIPYQLEVKINESGILNIKGDTVLKPFSSNIQIDAKNIAIKNFQPYIDKFVRLDIISGFFNINAKVALQQQDNAPLDILLNGNSHIDNLVTRDRISNKDFLNWKQLNLKNIELNLAANSYSIGSIIIDHPYTRVLIRKDKSININDIVKNTDQTNKVTIQNKHNKQSIKNETIAPAPTFKIAHFEVTEGITDFSDRSLILPFSAHLNHLKGSVKGISSDQNAVINVILNGTVENLAPVKIKGKISPNQGNSEFTLDFKSMPLPLMSPYMADFAGRKIEKGNMSLRLKYKIKNKQLTASNSLLIDQLILGKKVDNPEATSLPLGLAIALLEDANGQIKLDVPITGSLDDPEFSIGSIIVDALVNVISKIVTSPFYSIASLIGSDEDVSKITFSPGKALLDDKQRNKLDGLVNALSNRPVLKLEIKGAAFSENDWPQLQAEALDNLLLQIRADELNKNSDTKVLAGHIPQSDKENQRLLADLFIKEFPDLAEKSLFGTPRLLAPNTGDFYEVAKEKLAATIVPDSQRLRKLATARAQAITKHLVDNGIAIERIFLLDVTVDPKDSDNVIATILNLTTD